MQPLTTLRSRLLQLALVLGVGCAAPGAQAPEGDAPEATVSDAGGVSARVRCVSPAGAPSSPRSIAEVVDLLNAMPKPVTLPCFLDSLTGALPMQAANSVFSAQPAVGRRSPRIFLFLDPLVLSVVPAGNGSQLLEFGERRGEDQSLKAELEFPITSELDTASPFARLPFDETISSCGFCHQHEVAAPEIDVPFAMISPAMRPRPAQRVPLAELQAELDACDPEVEPDRCAMLDALFGRDAPPIEWDFPATYPTFF